VGSTIEAVGSITGMSDGEAEGIALGPFVGEGVGSFVGEGVGSFVGEGVGSSVVVVVVSISVVSSSPHMGASKSGGLVGAISVPSPQQSTFECCGVQQVLLPPISISV